MNAKSIGSYLRRREKKLLRKAKACSGFEMTKLIIQAKRTSQTANEYIFAA
jgi:hypothetical protein